MNQKQRYPLFPEDRSMSMMREQFPDIHKEPHLVFKDVHGKIRAGCYFGNSSFIRFDFGIVPDDVADQGAVAVRAFAQKKLDKLIVLERQRRMNRDENVLSLHREHVTACDGVVIKGFVEKGEHRGPRADFIRLTMTEPFQLVTDLYVRPQCFADGMHGTRSFDSDGNLLDQEIRRQEKALVEMYKREIRRHNRPPAHPLLSRLADSRDQYDDE